MYRHTNSPFPHSAASDLTGLDAATTLPYLTPQFPPPQLVVPDQLDAADFDPMHEVFRALNNDVIANCSSSGCSSYSSPSSLASYCTPRPSFIQRSVSSHSLHKNGFGHVVEFCDSDNAPVRRVYSTGDLQEQGIRMLQYVKKKEQNNSLWNENSIIIEGMSKACPYSPEEKKERIERYRSKKNLRNFNKKIKYACRKTLADSRPRIKGRFARNEESESNSNSHSQWGHIDGEEDGEEGDSWINLLQSFSANLIP